MEEHIFYHWRFLKTLIFEALYFLKRCPIFVGSEVIRSSSDQQNISSEFTHLHIPSMCQ
jgi:hypothetical protein